MDSDHLHLHTPSPFHCPMLLLFKFFKYIFQNTVFQFYHFLVEFRKKSHWKPLFFIIFLFKIFISCLFQVSRIFIFQPFRTKRRGRRGRRKGSRGRCESRIFPMKKKVQSAETKLKIHNKQKHKTKILDFMAPSTPWVQNVSRRVAAWNIPVNNTKRFYEAERQSLKTKAKYAKEVLGKKQAWIN